MVTALIWSQDLQFFRDAVRKTEESSHCTKACISLYNEGNGE